MQALASRIDAVTVYRTGAQITRLAALPAASDREPRVVSLPGLPLGLDDASIRARIVSPRGLGGPRAADVGVTLSVERTGEALLPANDAELEAAVIAVLEQGALVEQHERELERLGLLELKARLADAAGASNETMPKSPLAARLELLEHRRRAWREGHALLEAARAELAVRQRRVKTLKDRNERASSAREPRSSELRKCAVVTIIGGAVGVAAELALEYRVAGARWSPAYVAQLEADGTSATIGSRAVVAQKTGEDWIGAKLTLVTATADMVTELPVLHSTRIGRRQAPIRTGWRPPPLGTDALFGDYERVFGAAPAGPSARTEHQLFDERSDDEITAVEASASAPPPPPPAPAMVMGPGAQSIPPPPGAFSPDTLIMGAAQSAPKGGGAFAFLAKKAGSVVADLGDALEEAEIFKDAVEQAPAAPIRADEVLLDYGGLVMAAAAASGRGCLVREDPITRYRAHLEIEHWKVSIDLSAVVRGARREAERIASAALPPGHHAPTGTEFDYSYFTESRVDVPSDGNFHSIALSAASGPCKLRHEVCPRESCDVYRVARIENPLPGPLLPGPIDVYLGGDFLLSTQTTFTPPGGLLRFGLGVEQAVRVIRNTSFRDDSAGLLGGSRELHHQFRVEAQNHLSRSIELEVRERVPTVTEGEDEIRVEIGTVSPRWEAFEPGDDEKDSSPPLKGGFRWIEKLAPAAKVELKASYVIRISSKHELVGGNRREP